MSTLSTPWPICSGHLTQKFKFIEAFARSFGYRTERIFRNMDRQTGFLAQKFIESAQERAATREDQASQKFRRKTCQSKPHLIDNRRDRLEQSFAHFLRSNHQSLRQARDQIAP